MPDILIREETKITSINQLKIGGRYTFSYGAGWVLHSGEYTYMGSKEEKNMTYIFFGPMNQLRIDHAMIVPTSRIENFSIEKYDVTDRGRVSESYYPEHICFVESI